MNSNDSGLAHGTKGSKQLTIENGEIDIKIKENILSIEGMMPNFQKAITPMEKFLNYSLDYNNPNSRGKAEVY